MSRTGGPWQWRILLRYALLQIPSASFLAAILLALHHWLGLPWGWAVVILGAWLLKDSLLYPLLWRAYDPDPLPMVNTPVGRLGVVIRELCPEGQVRVAGELWRARLVDSRLCLGAGAAVRVIGMRGLTLRVRPEPPDAPPPDTTGSH